MPKKTKPERPQGEDAYLRIVAEIRSGKLSPGARITEVDLAQRFGISRTPVREAIRQLEADGLVIHTPRRGASIRSLGHAEISELYDMRAVLEGAAAEFAARAASAVELEELAAIHEAMVSASDAETLYQLNQHFHAGLLDAARNRFLVRAVAAVNKTLLILGRSTMEEGDRAKSALQEHMTILKALSERDDQAAGNAMRAHIAHAHRARLRQLRERRDIMDLPDADP